MKRLLLVAAGAALAVVPAVAGLTANPALSQQVPVRVPSQSVPVRVAGVPMTDDGSRVGRDDTGEHLTARLSSAAAATPRATGGSRAGVRGRHGEGGGD